jgi:hypothetical protein
MLIKNDELLYNVGDNCLLSIVTRETGAGPNYITDYTLTANGAVIFASTNRAVCRQASEDIARGFACGACVVDLLARTVTCLDGRAAALLHADMVDIIKTAADCCNDLIDGRPPRHNVQSLFARMRGVIGKFG